MGGRNANRLARSRQLRLRSQGLTATPPMLLAHHLTAAGDIERAVDQWLKAGLSAQGAFDESVACLRDALTGRPGAVTFRPFGFTRLALSHVGANTAR